MLWLAVLTIYQSYVTTDALNRLKSVETNQEYTLKYMEKSTSILKRIKKIRLPGETNQPASGGTSSASATIEATSLAYGAK